MEQENFEHLSIDQLDSDTKTPFNTHDIIKLEMTQNNKNSNVSSKTFKDDRTLHEVFPRSDKTQKKSATKIAEIMNYNKRELRKSPVPHINIFDASLKQKNNSVAFFSNPSGISPKSRSPIRSMKSSSNFDQFEVNKSS